MMVHGFAGEDKIVKDIEVKHGIAVSTSPCRRTIETPSLTLVTSSSTVPGSNGYLRATTRSPPRWPCQPFRSS
jgi:hypothetical protein